MPYEKLNIQLAVKLNNQGKLPEIFYQKLNEIYNPTQLQAIANMTLIEVVRAMIRRFRDYSERINSGQANEEITTIAQRHTCNHDIDPHGQCIEEDI